MGGGFGGAYCARALEKELRGSSHEIFLIDKNNYFVFYPLLIEAGTGNIEPRHAVVPIRPFLRNTHFHTGEVRQLDSQGRKISYEVPLINILREAEYDHLVVCLGSITRMIDIPGLREFAFEMKSLTDAVALRDRSIELCAIEFGRSTLNKDRDLVRRDRAESNNQVLRLSSRPERLHPL